MTGSRDRHPKRNSSTDSSSSDSSSSSSSSSSSEEKRHHRHHKKDGKKESRCNSEHSEIECYSNDKEYKNKDRKDRKHRKDSSSDCSDSSSSSSSSCSSEHKFDMNDIYQYFKNRLITDNHLMVTGSNAYLFAGNKENQDIPLLHQVKFENIYLDYNIEITHADSPFFVREDGIYMIFFAMATDASAQFTLFVNGIENPLTRLGTNSGAGQVISRHLVALKKDDNVVIRNYLSQNTVTSQTKSGGLLDGNDLAAIFVKIAPLYAAKECCEELKCLSRKKLRLFKTLTKKLVMDTELMVKGFNVTGSFYNTIEQTVNTESDVVFGAFQNVNGLQWNPTGANPEQIKVLEDGVYKLFFICNTNKPSQLTFCVNGIPDETTIAGSNRGAGQVTTRCLLTLKKNDIVTVRNHTSANGDIVISQNAGGFETSINAILTLIKIAPIVKAEVKPVGCKIEKKFECYYEKFRNYLLCKDWLQVAGSPAYLSMIDSSPQTLAVNEAASYSTNVLEKDVWHQQGKDWIKIKKSGIYDILIDNITDEPAQYTLFVNDNPDLSAVFGRDSGAAGTLLRQIVKLNKGDKVQVRNYTSHPGTIRSSVNAGGDLVDINKQFILFLLTPTCEPHMHHQPQPQTQPQVKCTKDDKCKK